MPPAHRPKTLHITNAYHGTSGGVRTFYHALLACAEDRGREIRLVVPSDRSEVERRGRFGLVHHMTARRAPFFDRRYRLLSPSHYLGVRRSPLARILASEAAEIVEVCDKYTLPLLARLARHGWYGAAPRPTVIGLSCERMDDNVAAYMTRHHVGARFARSYMRRAYLPAFDAHVANSEYTAAELLACGRSTPRNVHVCAMGVDVSLFRPSRRDAALRASLLAAAGGTESSLLVFYAGRLAPEKNLELLIDAVACLIRRGQSLRPGARDVRLVVAGDGPYRPALERRVARAIAGRVLFTDDIGDRALLARHYASADVFAHPNPREPFGIGPLEAMASGVPVVVPNAGGVLSYAHAANAWLAPPAPEHFAGAIADAAEGRATTRVRRAYDTARDHAWDLVAGRYFDVIDRVHAARVRARR